MLLDTIFTLPREYNVWLNICLLKAPMLSDLQKLMSLGKGCWKDINQKQTNKNKQTNKHNFW